MKQTRNYPTEQVKTAIAILSAMLEPDAPELTHEFNLYYEYMLLCSKNESLQQEALSRVEGKLNKVGINRPITALE